LSFFACLSLSLFFLAHGALCFNLPAASELDDDEGKSCTPPGRGDGGRIVVEERERKATGKRFVQGIRLMPNEKKKCQSDVVEVAFFSNFKENGEGVRLSCLQKIKKNTGQYKDKKN